jgi:isopentenyl phosphate kinase
MENKLFFLKLGGSLITKKEPYKLNLKKIREVAREIFILRKKYKFKLLLGNGAGSFAHISAKKFRTKEGYINKRSKIGHCIVQDDASTLKMLRGEWHIKRKKQWKWQKEGLRFLLSVVKKEIWKNV